ncbi:hypothetical protein D9758_009673 [Tetrapyrgos nigripes]|uniref:Uncharacterized protein n=1 Tax=Tetrapyrgos nigripes TaxID=182062 RepID=A0A8H5CPA2_9AGAR|nr:hypothetical protein D9758_009673 [Tetrapyrgos nigripes]
MSPIGRQTSMIPQTLLYPPGSMQGRQFDPIAFNDTSALVLRYNTGILMDDIRKRTPEEVGGLIVGGMEMMTVIPIEGITVKLMWPDSKLVFSSEIKKYPTLGVPGRNLPVQMNRIELAKKIVKFLDTCWVSFHANHFFDLFDYLPIILPSSLFSNNYVLNRYITFKAPESG